MEDTKLVQCPNCELIKVHDGCINNCEQCSVKRWETEKGWSLIASCRLEPKKPFKL